MSTDDARLKILSDRQDKLDADLIKQGRLLSEMAVKLQNAQRFKNACLAIFQLPPSATLQDAQDIARTTLVRADA